MATYDLAEKALILRPGDDVAVLKEALPAGTVLQFEGEAICVQTDVPPGHKMALRPVPVDGPVRKYGQTIGFATQAIAPGEHVHVHNLDCRWPMADSRWPQSQIANRKSQIGVGLKDSARDYAFATEVRPVEMVPAEERRTFEGYRRADGRVGTRNYVAVISTVNCSASVCRFIADHFREGLKADYPHVDGVIALTYKGGCGTDIAGEGLAQIRRTLAGHANHPNVAGCLLVGLGCETCQALDIIERHGLVSLGLPVLSIQACGGTTKTVAAGVREVEKLLARANECRRTPQPASRLVLAVECGGSDAYSGITANPALGAAADALVRQGGTVILGETTEMYGAEHLLTRRAVSAEVGQKLVERIRWWEQYAAACRASINNNPSPGNKAGGLTTIYEKSLGAIAKGGTTPVQEVYRYAEPVAKSGLVLMDTPGLDGPSVTGKVAGGATLVAFTTGRGSANGGVPTPVFKIASNTALYQRMADDMDFNAGVVLEGVSVEEVGQALFEELLAVASGRRTKSERLGLGEEEFAPWDLGPVL